MNNEQKLISLLSRVLNLNSEGISDSTSPENTSSWDSFSALVLVTELESEFDVSFSMEEVFAITCVADIRATLINHSINFDESKL
jgi:acyl carrier protein|tara:strand:- start:432 stop:686 length:255 start_codon:yes stop_codon:yes gene_type:complete